LNKSATNIPTECRIASIGPDDAMILPHDANPGRMQFWERTGAPLCITAKFGLPMTDSGQNAKNSH
jgi:hypothetical protein